MSMFRFFRRTDQTPTPGLDEVAIWADEAGVLSQKIGPHGAATPLAITPTIAAGLTASSSPTATNPFITASALAAGLIIAAGVPSGAPEAGKLPIAFDTTAVSGGAYYWNGSAWVKFTTI